MVVFAFLFIDAFVCSFILWMKPGEFWEGWLWLIFTKHFIKVLWISTCFNISKRIKPMNIRWILATQMTCQLATESCCFSVPFLPTEKREAVEFQLAWLSVRSVLSALRLVRCIERQRSHFYDIYILKARWMTWPMHGFGRSVYDICRMLLVCLCIIFL